MRHFIILFILICYGFIGKAQSKITLTGIVLSLDKKTPIDNANIKITAINQNTSTNNNGQFSITINSSAINNLFVDVSSIGYITQRIKINQTNFFKIFLKTDNSELSEVVVTSSYGTKKRKEDLVGSIVNLKGSDLQVKQSIESFDKMLDGMAAGVQVTSGSVVGAPVKINIRGQGSLTPLNGNLLGSSTQPLIIIDGVVMSEEAGFDNILFDGGATSEQFKNPLAKISPEDIESISILKDAAAVGLYGADAANGVIIVTTKKSKSKKLDFNFATQTGFSNPINQIQYLSGPQYFEMYKAYRISEGDSNTKATIAAGSNTIDTNWFELLNRTGSFQRYNASASFGINNFSFRASLNVLNNQEPQLNNSFVRYGGNLNVGYNSKKINLQLSLTSSMITQNEPNTLFSFPLTPNILPFNLDGSFANLGYRGFGNPLAVAAQNLNVSKTKGLLASINMSIPITKNLKISSILGIDQSIKTQDRYLSGFNESGQGNGSFIVNNSDGSTTTFNDWGRRIDTSRDNIRWNASTQIMFEKKKNLHTFYGLVGLELQSENTDNRRLLGRGFVNPGPINAANQALGNFSDNSYLSQSRKRSVFMQANYNYNNRYFFLGNLRRDESSAFGADVNAALNGGAGASWNISNENFFSEIKFIDFLRIRTSYGITGNSRIGSYRAKGLYLADINGLDGYNGNFVAYPETAPNPNLGWEKNQKFNIGLDFNIFQKYKFTIEFFKDNISDLITSRPVPLEIGFSDIQINGANMTNQGYEFSMQANWVISNNFRWSTNFNISTISNIVTSLTGLGSTYSPAERARAQKVGASTTAIWGVKFAGIDPATGRELFKKGDQVYDAATYRELFNIDDVEIIGDTQPDFFGGIQNNFTFFKNLTLGIRANFKYGGDVLIDDGLESNYQTLINKNLSVNVIDRWQNQGDFSKFPAVTSTNPNLPNSSKYLYDASQIKIQNINLNYDFPLKKYNIKTFDSLSFSVDVSNVFYIYRQKSPDGRNGIQEYMYKYPEARTITFGFQTNF